MTDKMQNMDSGLSATIEKTTVKPRDAERAAIREMVKSAKARGEDITGPDGLLKLFTKTVLETALDEEMTDHLGYEKHAVEGRNGANSRNGTRTKTVISDAVGPVEIEVPRDRDGSFRPQIVARRQRRLGSVDEVVLSLYSRGLTTGEISAHFAEVYGASVSKSVISAITEKVVAEMTEWSSRPLASHYVAVFVDAVHVKVRDGQVANRPFYAAIGVDLAGRRDVLGLWAGTAGIGRVVQVLDLDLDRAEEPGRGRHLLPGLRRPEGDARLGERRVPGDDRADLCRASDQEHVPVFLEAVLGRARQGRESDLHRRRRRRGVGGVRIPGGEMGKDVPGDRETVAECVGRVRAVPGLRHRDPPGAVDHERDRIVERPVPPVGRRERAFPVRTGRPQDAVPHHPVTGPERHRTETLDDPVEARPERPRGRLRRPHAHL